MELWLLDLANGKTQQLTNGGAVNVEPRWSPDGKRIVLFQRCTTSDFMFSGGCERREIREQVRLTGRRRASCRDITYSAFDRKLSSGRGRKGILFVSNRGHIHGTGGFWR